MKTLLLWTSALSDISCLHKFSDVNFQERTKHGPPFWTGSIDPPLWSWSMDPHFGTTVCFRKGKKRTTIPHFNRNILEILFFILDIYVIMVARAILPVHEDIKLLK